MRSFFTPKTQKTGPGAVSLTIPKPVFAYFSVFQAISAQKARKLPDLSSRQIRQLVWRRVRDSNYVRKPRWGFHEPVQTLANSFILFSPLRKENASESLLRCKNSLQPAYGGFFYKRISEQPLISPSAANNEALAAALQNKPSPAPAASFHWPYAQRENPSAPSDRCTQTSRRHSTIYNTPH